MMRLHKLVSGEKKTSFADEFPSHGILNELEFILENHPNDITKEYGLSLINVLLGNFDDAFRQLESALKKKPDDSALNRHMAEILMIRQDYHQAIQHLEKAFEHDNLDYKSYALLIMLYYRIGDHDQATKGLNKLEKIVTRLEVSIV